MVRAAVYCRISLDADGQGAGVRRQQEDCVALAAQKGWDVAEIYVDNDISAYSGKRRPQYRRMLEAVKAGEVDAVIVWHLDRLTRRPAELEEFFETCDSAGVKNLATCTGDIDLGTDDGRFMARILGAAAKKESDDKRRRVKRKHLQLAKDGRPSGGGRPFGFESDRITHRPEEAAIVREAAARVLAGESLWAITRDWNQRGVATARGGRGWTQTAVRRVLTSPRTAGLRSHNGTVVGPAVWEPIIDEATWRHVCSILTDRRQTWPRRARSYLLTGLLECSRCGTKMIGVGHRRSAKNPRGRTYACPLDPGKGGCGGLRIVQPQCDDWVIDQILDVLASPQLERALRAREQNDEDARALDEVGDLERRLEQLARDHYADQIISRAQFIAATQELNSQLDAAKRRLIRARERLVLSPVTGPRTREQFDELGLDRQRAIVSELIEKIVVLPATAKRWQAHRVDIRWKPIAQTG